jgi:coenzyme Q-binding protein COQ10
MSRYVQRRQLGYTATRLFDLVVDVERYPEFIPWMIATRVCRRTERNIWTDLTVGIGPLRKQFSTIATLDRPQKLSITSTDPTFVKFEQLWTFQALPTGGTDVGYVVEFEFKSRLLQALMDATFSERAAAIVTAYVQRAGVLYGPPSRA